MILRESKQRKRMPSDGKCHRTAFLLCIMTKTELPKTTKLDKKRAKARKIAKSH